MNPKPKKWIAFQIISAFISLISFFIVAALIFQINKVGLPKNSAEDKALLFAIILGFLIIFLFGIFCIYLMRAKFPDREISAFHQNLFRIFNVFIFLCAAALICLFIYGLGETVEVYAHNREDQLSIYLLIALTSFIAMLIYVFIAAQKLMKNIKSSFREAEQNSIDALGQNTF